MAVSKLVWFIGHGVIEVLTVSALAWEDKQTHDERHSGYPVTLPNTPATHSLPHSLE
jgi:hypothetical protein